MQTLKTAAIVVLLMTVMYGAYVSLTTPPEPLPADVEDMLMASEEESLSIDVGLPASLGEMQFGDTPSFPESSTTPQSPTFPSSGAPDSAPSFGPPSQLPSGVTPGPGMELGNSPPSFDVPGFGPAATAGTTSSGANLAPSEFGNAPVTASLSDGASANFSASPASFGNPNSGNPTLSGAPNGENPGAGSRQYPATSNTFDLPNPNDVVASLNAQQPSAGFGTDSSLALASGTSASPGANVSPTAGMAPAEPGIRISSGLANAIQAADRQYAEDRRKDALATLSMFYNSPSMTGEERSALLARLDPLAREVIYSNRHLLEQPHRVGQKETLMDIAARYEVPWQLLANINQISDPVTILPGTELKVVKGPFRAEVNLTLKELTLFLGDLYAGRFPVGIGRDPLPKTGTFTVQDKLVDRTYYDPSGVPVPPGSPNNPYGKVFLDLGGQLSIHGSPSTTSPSESGCISLAGDYAEDLYGILSQGSSVTIRR